MLRLEDREWGTFTFSELFSIERGNYSKRPAFNSHGVVPFLGATATNNGVTGWCGLIDTSMMQHGDCITVTNNGSVGHAYYWRNQFMCSSDLNILRLKHQKHMGVHVALFLITMIERQATSFSYARKWSVTRMKGCKLMLPVSDKGNPDYQFMGDYIRQMIGIKL